MQVAAGGSGLIARRFGCFWRSEQARPFDQPLQARYPFPDAPQLSFEQVQPLVRPGLQQEHQAAQGYAHAKDPDQLRAHAISLAVTATRWVHARVAYSVHPLSPFNPAIVNLLTLAFESRDMLSPRLPNAPF